MFYPYYFQYNNRIVAYLYKNGKIKINKSGSCQEENRKFSLGLLCLLCYNIKSRSEPGLRVGVKKEIKRK